MFHVLPGNFFVPLASLNKTVFCESLNTMAGLKLKRIKATSMEGAFAFTGIFVRKKIFHFRRIIWGSGN